MNLKNDKDEDPNNYSINKIKEIKSTNLNHNQSPMKKLNHSKNSHKDNSKSDSEFDEDSIEDEHEKEKSKNESIKKEDEEPEAALKKSEIQTITPEKKRPKWKDTMNEYLQNMYLQGSMGIVTIYILFSDDIKLLTTTKDSDPIFSIICLIVIFLYSFEFVCSCICIEDYVFNFYFWLDFLSVFAMFLDVDWIYMGLIYALSGAGSGTTPGSKNANAKSLSSIFRAGRAAKIGSRAIRVLRIIRLIRLNKLYKNSEKYLQKNQSAVNKQNPESNDQNVKKNQSEESKVGKKLSELTTKRVIILVLSMMIGIILFNSSFYYETKKSMELGIKIFKSFDVDDPNLNITFSIYVVEHLNVSTPILYAQVGNLTWGNLSFTETLRDGEKVIAYDTCPNISPNPDIGYCLAIFDNRLDSAVSSILNIAKTFFVCIIFSVGSMFFFKDVLEMVLTPIESMTKRVKNMADNPMMALQEAERIEFFNSLMIGESKGGCCSKNKKKVEPLETEILEKTISKIGALLVLGFGEAGSEIIAKNLSNANDGDVNPMIAGKKVIAVYGFCDIRNFTDATEVLQEKVMVFVNEIAEIVHEITTDNLGSANKNIGDAFLLVWKFEDKFTMRDESGELKLLNIRQVNQLVDCSVISFLKILSKVYKSYKLDKYRRDEGLNNRIKNYAVKMGFGLHLGWSIEGAIGSVFKIDASYLSPNVNKSSKLEEKTKEYGVQLILSGEIYEYLSLEAKEYARIIDIIPGDDNLDFKLYTIDFDLTALTIEKEDEAAYKQEDQILTNSNAMSKLKKYKKRLERKEKYESFMTDEVGAWSNYEKNDEDFRIMRMKYDNNKIFYEEYNMGFENYIKGDWKQAKHHFDNAETALGDKDGPIQHLMSIMIEYNYEKPKDYKLAEGNGH